MAFARASGGARHVLSTARYFLTCAADSMARNRGRTALAALTVMTPLFVLGVFAHLSGNLAPYVQRLRIEAHVVVFLTSEGTPDDRRALEGLLAGPEVARFHYVGPEEALERLAAMVGGGFSREILPDNPMPASYEVWLTPEASERAAPFVRRLQSASGVEEVGTQLDLMRRLSLLLTISRLLGAVLAAILALAATVTMSNIVRLVFVAKSEEVTILKVVGATDLFVRGPFLVEGTMLGLLGGALASGLLAAVHAGVVAAATRHGGLVADVAAALWLRPIILAALPLGGAIIGALAGLSALRKLLRPAE